jgi:Alpha-glutamyl/putrescinyl thymine pyrophosphorylase clade 2
MKNKLSIYNFGKQLVETLDLDPVYVVVHHAQLPETKLDRWLIAYWCFYHVGTASWIVDQPDYWKAMMQAASSKDWPRASERRHFRGQAAIKSVTWLEANKIDLRYFREASTLSLADVMTYVKSWQGFGNWIAFKAADMLERLGVAKIEFTPDDIFKIFEAPRKGAEEMAIVHGPAEGNVYAWAHKRLSVAPALKLLAPPLFERRLNIQELETILCKWKSHRNDHYIVGKDIAETKHALQRFDCPTSKKLYKAGSTGGLW